MSQSYEVPEPILNSPFNEPSRHWFIREGEEPELRTGRRPAIVYPPRDERPNRQVPWTLTDGTLKPSTEYSPGFELILVNLIRERVAEWRRQDYPGVTRTTHELLHRWHGEGGGRRFFAQIEAVETTIFLVEARADLRQGIVVPRDEPSDDKKAEGYKGFLRYSCKMATGTGKTTVIAMLAAWSILNKVTNRSDARFSDVVLIVCPNVTIRNRLQEVDPENGEASLYRTRDLVPGHLMPKLREGKVLVMNWHVFEPHAPQAGGESARVLKTGQPVPKIETIRIGSKTTTARGSRYLTPDEYHRQRDLGLLKVRKELPDADGNLTKVEIETVRYVESDTAFINRLLGREIGGKQNLLVMNDEAHHAYRIRREEPDEEEGDLFGDEEEAEKFFQEATVWIEGLDKIQKLRGINLCVDLSATPYFLGRVGQETNRPFPWVVSDFGLIDSIESGLVKIPQLAVRDTTGAEIPGYFKLWHWILERLTPRERGGKRANPKPEAILKWADQPIRMLGGLWEELCKEWAENSDDPRKPVFIIVCKTTQLARVLYEWLAEDKAPVDIPTPKIADFRNKDGIINTIRVDCKVVHETDTGEAKSDESRWMRFTLDTVGKTGWPRDRQGRPLYPEGFEELAKKLERPLHPPGRNVRCIVSVGMLTEGWDCNTVTHIVGLRPFMSQLLCEQVVGRGLRRVNYEVDEKGLLREEVAKVFGVPFEVIPFKANKQGPVEPPPRKWHVHALPAKASFEIQYPRVEGYTQGIRNQVAMDWANVPGLVLDPGKIPPEVEVKGLSVNVEGRLSLSGPGGREDVTLKEMRDKLRIQEVVFDIARGLTRHYLGQPKCEVPAHVLFPQLARLIGEYIDKKVTAHPPADKKDVYFSPYYGWLVEILTENIHPDTSQGEVPEIPLYESHRGPGSTAEVDFWTSRDVREIVHSHLNYIVSDTERWEQAAAYFIDKHKAVDAFVKNTGLGFGIPYLHNGQMHDYFPDFIVRLKTNPKLNVILETKGYDPLEDVKRAAAERWCAAVNAEGSYGKWRYVLVKKISDIPGLIDNVAAHLG